MKNDELVLIRNKQSEFDFKLKKLQEYKKRILKLEQEPNVREYLELISFVNDNNEVKIKKQHIDEIDKVICNTKDSNKLLYDYGEVLVNTYESCFSSEEDEWSSEHVYRDLETGEYYFEAIDEIELMPPGWRVGSFAEDGEYEMLRKYFIEQLQFRQQEYVVQDILKKNKKLIKSN